MGNDARSAREQVLHGSIPRVFRDRFVRGEPISAALTDVIERALQRVTAARFGSFGEMTSALGRCGAPAPREEVAAFVERVMPTQLARGQGEGDAPRRTRPRPDTLDAPTKPPVTGQDDARVSRTTIDSLTPTLRPPAAPESQERVTVANAGPSSWRQHQCTADAAMHSESGRVAI